MRITIPVDKAKEMAEASGLQNVADRVEKAAQDGWDLITLEAVKQADGSFDIGATAPTGVMVAWMLPQWTAERVALPGGEAASELHVTLAYLGDASALSLDQQRTLIGVVAEVAARHQMLTGYLQGTGRFVNGDDVDAFWVGVNIPGLAELREDLRQSLEAAGIPLAGYGATAEYTPHVTVAYLPKDQETPSMTYKPEQVSVDTLTVCVGPHQFQTILPYPESDLTYQPGGWAPDVVNKAMDTVEEARYTLSVWYVPDRLDAHGEWADKEELQKAFWNYMANPDKGIRLQHNKSIVVGQAVDGVVWPDPITVTLNKADGTSVEHTFPAGTPFLGVKWSEEAWPLVKAGKIRGYSIGGTSKRMLVDLPKEEKK
jgi:2'-5' RNA ligase